MEKKEMVKIHYKISLVHSNRLINDVLSILFDNKDFSKFAKYYAFCRHDCIWHCFNKKHDSQKRKRTRASGTRTKYYDPITLENTYKLVRAGLCYVIGEIFGVISVRKPMSYTQMDAPTHYDIVANVPIYHLLIAKTGKEIDTYMVMGIIQNAIEQKLNNNEFNGISQAVFFYNGQAYPSIMVDKVLDCGNMLRIDIAVASEYYCKYRERRIYNNMNGSDNGDFHDKDF